MKDTINDANSYSDFYEELGQKYPESALVHVSRGPGSRYWTVSKELLPYAQKTSYMLDVECNDGVYTIPYCQGGGRALGIDISTTLIERAHENARRVGIDCGFMAADIESPHVVNRVGDRFDVALFSEVLEHLRNPNMALHNIHSFLKPKGSLILTTPTPLFEVISSLTAKYLHTVLRGNKLSEGQVIDTTELPTLRKHGISAYKFRHDGYYPLALRRHVESMGFKCLKFYTIAFDTPLAIRQLSALFRGLMIPPRRGQGIENGQRPAYEKDLIPRKIPIVNLLGATNVAVFKKSH